MQHRLYCEIEILASFKGPIAFLKLIVLMLPGPGRAQAHLLTEGAHIS